VDVNAAGTAIRWFVDPQNGPHSKGHLQNDRAAWPRAGETDMDDWKPVSGLTLPMGAPQQTGWSGFEHGRVLRRWNQSGGRS